MAKIFTDDDLRISVVVDDEWVEQEKVQMVTVRWCELSIKMPWQQFMRVMAFMEFMAHPKY